MKAFTNKIMKNKINPLTPHEPNPTKPNLQSRTQKLTTQNSSIMNQPRKELVLLMNPNQTATTKHCSSKLKKRSAAFSVTRILAVEEMILGTHFWAVGYGV